MSASVSQGEGSGRRGTVLAVAGLMLALFLVALDQTVVGTALPKIIADLDGFEHYAWVTTASLLASTAMIPVIGKLGDIYGRKWFIIGGVALFLAASALCGAAWGMTELISNWTWASPGSYDNSAYTGRGFFATSYALVLLIMAVSWSAGYGHGTKSQPPSRTRTSKPQPRSTPGGPFGKLFRRRF